MYMPGDDEIASERANRYAPRPRYSSYQAGILGAFGASTVLISFMVLTAADRERVFWIKLIILTLSFAFPFLYVRSRELKHFEACTRELAAIASDRAAKQLNVLTSDR